RADLVVTRSNPARDLGALREIEAVCVNGYYLARRDLDHLLAQRATLAAAPPTLPAIHLAPVEDEVTGVDEGTWIERIVDATAGRVAFRHARLRDGGWLIEERHVASVPRRHTERRNTRLVLDADFTMRSCAYTIDSCAGSEVGRITWSAPGAYAIEVTEVDGWKTHERVVGDRMLPSERMTVTLWPLLVSGRSIASPGLTAPILDVAASNVAVRQIRLEVTDSAQSGDTVERHWRLTADRPTHSTE